MTQGNQDLIFVVDGFKIKVGIITHAWVYSSIQIRFLPHRQILLNCFKKLRLDRFNFKKLNAYEFPDKEACHWHLITKLFPTNLKAVST